MQILQQSLGSTDTTCKENTLERKQNNLNLKENLQQSFVSFSDHVVLTLVYGQFASTMGEKDNEMQFSPML